MAQNVARKLIADHLLDGRMDPGEEIALRIDQTLTQDATGTLVMLELEAMDLDRVRTDVSAQYVDHNLVQEDHRNPDDHLFLESACRRWGVWYSRAGNGVSHPVHMERFGVPGATLLGSDSHTPAAGSLGMLAMGAGGLEVALAMAGAPFHVRMPKVRGVRLTGELPDWVSAKDVILEMLRRYDVDGHLGWIVEYHGPGLAALSAMDRHVIANMGTELGATTTVFPSDGEVRRFLRRQGREDAFREIVADDGATYDANDEIDLSSLEPLVALPSSPGKVVPVREISGDDLYQAYVGSSANPGFRDFAVAARSVDGRQVADSISFDVNPTSRQILEELARSGDLARLIRAGARIHQAGCNGCIGMGQAPASGRNSVRTVPRNFPGRSGTREDAVFLVSPETAAASALLGRIADPRELEEELGIAYPRVEEPDEGPVNEAMLVAPGGGGSDVELVKGPNVASIPDLGPLPGVLSGPVLLKVGDDVSTDEILPAGARVLPYRSNIPKISEFTFWQVDEGYAKRAMEHREGGHFIVGGSNYGQGSSREHAALAPRYLGVKAVLARGFARIHAQNLANFGILPLVFLDEADYDAVEAGAELEMAGVRSSLESGSERVAVHDRTSGRRFEMAHHLSERQVRMVLAGGVLNGMRSRVREAAAAS
ncbi:MAG: aconitate hydratase [Gemmatimonadetes bacterium]|nr:aconitate hydratase [Gemmatimonadota bacterium]